MKFTQSIIALQVGCEPGREIDLGPVYAHVKFKVSGNVCDPSYRPKDGDAAFLDTGSAYLSGRRPANQ